MSGGARPPADCARCPRLVALRHSVREQYPDYHAAPVAAWGKPSARLLIVGLAPGMHGANRSGRPFTGDASGDFLFAALHRAGLASEPRAQAAELNGIRITNVVKCVPPGNRPLGAEISACRSFLEAELAELVGRRPRRNRVILALGRQAHDALIRAYPGAVEAAAPRSKATFEHGGCVRLGRRVWLLDSYHPSRLNTNTGRLTPEMLDRVLVRAMQLIDD